MSIAFQIERSNSLSTSNLSDDYYDMLNETLSSIRENTQNEETLQPASPLTPNTPTPLLEQTNLIATAKHLKARQTPTVSLPSTPRSSSDGSKFGLAWLNLTFSPHLFLSKKTKTILRNICGQIQFGTILGLMGPSGCGKSTLLRCINGRIESGLNGETEIYVSKTRTIHSCFIVQDQKEHLLMGLTAKESLLYASKIKNRNSVDPWFDDEESMFDRSMSSTATLAKVYNEFDHIKNVNKLLNELTLNDCAHTLIYNCSGGQQKRIVIAMELMGQIKPNIMCIDEPTSGLDSNAAEMVIECLRKVSRKHSIGIVTTIHQPNSDVLMMFDALYVLSKGGYCVYYGKPGHLRQYLNNNRIDISETQVPIEKLLKVASKVTPIDLVMQNTFVVDEDVMRLADCAKQAENAIRSQCIAFGKLTNEKNVNSRSVSFNIFHFWYLTVRNTIYNLRLWKSIVFVSSFEFIAGVCTSFLFGKTGQYDGCVPFDPNNMIAMQKVSCINGSSALVNISQEEHILQNFKLLFFINIMHNFLQLCFTVLTFPSEVKIFLNEQQNRWYSTGSYYWAKNLNDLIIGIIITYFYVWITYAITAQMGMSHWYNAFYSIDKRFVLSLLANILCLFSTQGMAYFFSIISVRNLQVALCLSIGGHLTINLFSGFFIPISDMNSFLQYLSDFSYVKLAFETQIQSVYGYDRCDVKLNQWSMPLYQLKLRTSVSSNLKMLLIQGLIWRVIALCTLIVKANDFKPICFNFKKHNSIESQHKSEHNIEYEAYDCNHKHLSLSSVV